MLPMLRASKSGRKQSHLKSRFIEFDSFLYLYTIRDYEINNVVCLMTMIANYALRIGIGGEL
jgi:hypothetical protein